VLPAVDLSSAKAARLSLALAFCRRFLALRQEVPEAGKRDGVSSACGKVGVAWNCIAYMKKFGHRLQ